MEALNVASLEAQLGAVRQQEGPLAAFRGRHGAPRGGRRGEEDARMIDLLLEQARALEAARFPEPIPPPPQQLHSGSNGAHHRKAEFHGPPPPKKDAPVYFARSYSFDGGVGKLEESEKNVASLKMQISEQDCVIRDLMQMLDKEREQVAILKAGSPNGGGHLAKQLIEADMKLTEKTALVAELEAAVTSHKATIDWLHGRLRGQDDAPISMDEVSRLVAELDVLREENKALRAKHESECLAEATAIAAERCKALEDEICAVKGRAADSEADMRGAVKAREGEVREALRAADALRGERDAARAELEALRIVDRDHAEEVQKVRRQRDAKVQAENEAQRARAALEAECRAAREEAEFARQALAVAREEAEAVRREAEAEVRRAVERAGRAGELERELEGARREASEARRAHEEELDRVRREGGAERDALARERDGALRQLGSEMGEMRSDAEAQAGRLARERDEEVARVRGERDAALRAQERGEAARAAAAKDALDAREGMRDARALLEARDAEARRWKGEVARLEGELRQCRREVVAHLAGGSAGGGGGGQPVGLELGD